MDPGCWKQSLRRVIIPQIPVKGKWISPVPRRGKRLDARPRVGYSARLGRAFGLSGSPALRFTGAERLAQLQTLWRPKANASRNAALAMPPEDGVGLGDEEGGACPSVAFLTLKEPGFYRS